MFATVLCIRYSFGQSQNINDSINEGKSMRYAYLRNVLIR